MENIRAGPIAGTLPVTSTLLASATAMVKIVDEGVARFRSIFFHFHSCWVWHFWKSLLFGMYHLCFWHIQCQVIAASLQPPSPSADKKKWHVVGFIWSVYLNITCEHSGSWFPSYFSVWLQCSSSFTYCFRGVTHHKIWFDLICLKSPQFEMLKQGDGHVFWMFNVLIYLLFPTDLIPQWEWIMTTLWYPQHNMAQGFPTSSQWAFWAFYA